MGTKVVMNGVESTVEDTGAFARYGVQLSLIHIYTILGNCDTTLFLGGKEKTTLKEMSERLGKETIDLYNTSETSSNQKSFGLNYQKTGKQLMTEDEIAVL